MSYEFEISKSYELLHQNNIQMYHIWLKYVLYTWQWWLQVALTIVPWIVWFIFRKKGSTDRLMYSGLFIIISSYLLDIVGVAFGLWQYRYELLPITPSITPWDLSLIPVAVMFMLQINPMRLNRFIKAVIFSVAASFILEPIFVHIGFYKMLRWSYIYSFPITALLYITADWLSRRKKFSMID